jgi:hypothetical protein
MKKIVFLLVVIVPISLKSFSQKGLGFGFGGAVNSTWILNQNTYGDAELKTKSKFNTEGQVTVGYNILPCFGVWTGFGVAKLGQKYEGEQNSLKATRNIDLLYSVVPVLLRFSAGGERVKFHGLVGPEFAFLRYASQEYERGGTVLSDTSAVSLSGLHFDKGANDITGRYQKNDILLLVDLGIDLYLTSSLFINAGLKINYGFKDINAADYRLPNSKNEYKASQNAYAGISVGINYLIKKD